MLAPDANGIRRYQETDIVDATFSGFLNKIIDDISSAFSRSAYAEAGGTLAVNGLAAGATQTITVTFPTSRFSVSPLPSVLSGDARVSVSVTALSATSMTLLLANLTTGATIARTGYWKATQMKRTTAEG